MNTLKFLFPSREKFSTQNYQFTIQDALRDFKSVEELTQQKDMINQTIKRIPIVKENESIKKGKNQPTREKQEIESKQESASIQSSAIQGEEEGMPQDIKPGHLPFREAVILSEIIGAPRCKSRFKRRG